MWIPITFVCLFVNLVGYGDSMYSSKSMEGYPTGYISDCPSSDKEPIITKKTLKRLRIYLQGEGSGLSSKKTRFTYYQMKHLANHPEIDFSKPTVLYVGGFLDSPVFPLASAIGPLYRKLGYNTLLLDTNYFTTMPYPLASLYMPVVGRHTAEMLSNLTVLGLDPKKLELVGLSLGGHTVSFIAKNYRALTGMNISRITGLDIAGPCFRNLGPDRRLDLSDADFVDTIHTNIDGYGMAAPVGHVNFYVNGGEYQPGDVLWMPCDAFCSHVRSYTIWVAALLNPDQFIAMQCSSVQEARFKDCYDKDPHVTNIVGLKTDRKKEGIFYLATLNNFPYYLGKQGLLRDNEYFSSLMRSIVQSSDMIL